MMIYLRISQNDNNLGLIIRIAPLVSFCFVFCFSSLFDVHDAISYDSPFFTSLILYSPCILGKLFYWIDIGFTCFVYLDFHRAILIKIGPHVSARRQILCTFLQ